MKPKISILFRYIYLGPPFYPIPINGIGFYQEKHVFYQNLPNFNIFSFFCQGFLGKKICGFVPLSLWGEKYDDEYC
ncbi:MAG TPA: hypothetical protein DHV62_00160 [Elusimicrobia bacterium]|nr:hypothetical protein [Elusimicrobiota bacterium]